MKQGWEKRKFENCIGKIPKPQQLKTSDYMLEGKFPIVSQETCMISGYTDIEEYVYHVHEPVVVFGDHTRNIKYIDFDFVVGADGVKILVPTEDFNVKFFYYFLTWYNIPSLGYSRHYKLLKDIDIPLPPLPIQEKIVSELDCINGILDNKRQQLKELDALAQSLFYQMFGDPINNEKGWEVKKLGDVTISVNYGTSLPAVEGGEFKYLRMNNITYDGYLDLKDIKHITVPEKEFEKCVVKKGDILFNRTNSKELIGKTAMFDLDEKMIIAGYIIRVRVDNEKVLPIYIARYMNTKFIKSYLSNLCKGAVNQANINSKELRTIPLPLPPLPLQQSFASKIEAIEKQKELIKQSIADIETLLACRMQYWFE